MFVDLPEDIVLLILDLLVPKDYDEWKQQLSLLSVCQNLRRLALPQMYKHMFIADTSQKFSTNIDLVATSGFVGYLSVSLELIPKGHVILDDVTSVLNKHLEVCSHITKLSMNLISDRHVLLPENFLANIESRIWHSTERLIQILPAISELTLCGGRHDECCIYLRMALCYHYGTQLSKLQTIQCALPTRNLQLNQITHLNLMLAPRDSDPLPLICSQSIQCMNITALQPRHTWNLFSRESGSSLQVPYLRELKLNFVSNLNNRDYGVASMIQKCKLHFPRLRILELNGSAPYFPLLNMAVLPDKMDKISIKADAKTFMTFTNVVLPAARSTICKVFGDEPVDGSRFLSVFNQLMRNSLGCESVIVNITDCVSSCVGTLRCPGLTNLELNVMVDFNTMNAIIANHPRLIKLWLTASSKGWSEKEDESRQSIAPLNTSIREVRIDDYTARNPSSLQTTVLKYLMLRLPALHRVYGLAVDSSRLQQFVSKHLPEYPQLANIRFESESG